jgi:hypothetical protein
VLVRDVQSSMLLAEQLSGILRFKLQPDTEYPASCGLSPRLNHAQHQDAAKLNGYHNATVAAEAILFIETYRPAVRDSEVQFCQGSAVA